MNILITGASRGIGAAAYALLKKTGHNVVGHSTKGSDELIAGDLTDPAAPRDIWDTALDELGGEIDVLVNNAGIYEARGRQCARRGMARGLAADADHQPSGRGRPHRGSPCRISSTAAGAGGSSMSPAAPLSAAIRRSIGIMPRRRRRWSE